MRGRATDPLRGLRVLVVEDELLISQFICEVLVSLKCKVIGPIRTLDEALQAIRTNDIDGALLDVQLGEARVYPAVDALVLRRIPFILMTGDADLRGAPAHLAGAPVLPKPFRVEQLKDILSSTFRVRD
jgi:CheY-like chemotaxis protein